MNWLDLINVVANILIGITAIVSLWFSLKALKKSEWDSAMGTAPSLILRPTSIWVGSRESGTHGYGNVEVGGIIKAEHKPFEIVFTVEFECFNAGRGVAFNISQPKSEGMPISEFRVYKTPLYQTLEDEPFRIELQLKKNFDDWFSSTGNEIPVRMLLTYTNDQSNVYCRSCWTADIKPFDRDGNNLKVRRVRLIDRRGKIDYSNHSYET